MHKTNEEALAAWDAGDAVWSCELGGLGPGYEQGIQMMGFEMLRAMIANPFNWPAFEKMDGDEKTEAWRPYRDTIEDEQNVKDVIERVAPSGAQFGAAMNIASVFARNGYEKGMDMVPQDRRILVCRAFPADPAS